MEWQDEAIILAARPHGETSLILQVLTREHGRHAGLVRGARRSRGRGVYETGNRITADWRGRLADPLGTLRGELLRGDAAHLIDRPARFSCLPPGGAPAQAAPPQ